MEREGVEKIGRCEVGLSAPGRCDPRRGLVTVTSKITRDSRDQFDQGVRPRRPGCAVGPLHGFGAFIEHDVGQGPHAEKAIEHRIERAQRHGLSGPSTSIERLP